VRSAKGRADLPARDPSAKSRLSGSSNSSIGIDARRAAAHWVSG